MPSLEWEENAFLGLKALYKSVFVSRKQRQICARQALLADQRGMLLLTAKMLSARELALFETQDAVLYFGDRICLPDRIYLSPTQALNQECYLLRTVVAALAIRWELYAENSGTESLLTRCGAELPVFAARLERLLATIGGIQQISALIPRLPTTAESAAFEEKFVVSAAVAEDSQNQVITEVQGHARVNVTEVQEGDTGQQDTPFHTFEKVETLDEYNGLSRQNDAEDEILEHQEALSQLRMDKVLRTQERSQSVYRADLMLDGLGLELRGEAQSGIAYPEWDYKRKTYREKWCFVQEVPSSQVDSAWAELTRIKHASLILTLKKRFASAVSEWCKAKRQMLGSEFDLEGLTELLIRLRTLEAPPEDLYLGRRRGYPEIATLLLLDTSFSTDSWTKNRRVLDVMKETALCIAEVLEDAQQPFGIYGFSSNTRQGCRLIPVKCFDQSWRVSRAALGGVESQGYTRIGPALRHAYERIIPKKVEKKLVLLLTDGKPCDYDRYEGQYGIHDVRKAISEGTRKGVTTHAFAIDKQAREYFPVMFSRNNYDIVAQPEKLVATLFQVYLKLLVPQS